MSSARAMPPCKPCWLPGLALAMLAGFVMIGEVAGTYEINRTAANRRYAAGTRALPAALLLVLVGAFTKSAQFPFHFWLPNAMEAPTPVSAYLHYGHHGESRRLLLARLCPCWGKPGLADHRCHHGAAHHRRGGIPRHRANRPETPAGLLHRLSSGDDDPAFGPGRRPCVKAAVAFITAHEFYKGAPLWSPGSVDHETGTRDIRLLGNLGRKMPLTAISAGLAALSMAGVLPLFGFVAKELLYEKICKPNPGSSARWEFGALVNVVVAAWSRSIPFWRRPLETGREHL